ncbi:Myc-type, basic helix-loop-helix domain-containing protein [Gorgonomyces haynaldii]|nr:Myc-type, basic helix-loop-helix domain-containing protein [Gorgonomyces haynaldii]
MQSFHPYRLSPQMDTLPVDQQLQELLAQEQKRKESHSAIERRRRDRINDKIIVLKSLIPGLDDDLKRNLPKLTVLEAAIDYIHQLRKEIDTLKETSEDDKPAPSSTMKLANLLC